MTKLIMISTEEELNDEYDCFKPCNYMEYKVYKQLLQKYNICSTGNWATNSIWVQKKPTSRGSG